MAPDATCSFHTRSTPASCTGHSSLSLSLALAPQHATPGPWRAAATHNLDETNNTRGTKGWAARAAAGEHAQPALTYDGERAAQAPFGLLWWTGPSSVLPPSWKRPKPTFWEKSTIIIFVNIPDLSIHTKGKINAYIKVDNHNHDVQINSSSA